MLQLFTTVDIDEIHDVHDVVASETMTTADGERRTSKRVRTSRRDCDRNDDDDETMTWPGEQGGRTIVKNRYEKLLSLVSLVNARSAGPYVPRTREGFYVARKKWKQYGTFVYPLLLDGVDGGVVAFDENGKEAYGILRNPAATPTAITYFVHAPYRSAQVAGKVAEGRKFPLPPTPTKRGHGLMWAMLYGDDAKKMNWGVMMDGRIRDAIATRLVYVTGQKVAIRTCKSFVETWALGRGENTFNRGAALDAPRNVGDGGDKKSRDATERLQNVLRRGLDASYLVVRLVTTGLLTVTRHYRARRHHHHTENPHEFYTLSTCRESPSSPWTLNKEMADELNRRLTDLRLVRHAEPYRWDLYIRVNDETTREPNVWIVASPFLYDGRYVLHVWHEGDEHPTQLTFHDEDYTLTSDSCAVVDAAFHDITVKRVPDRLDDDVFENGGATPVEEPRMASMQRLDGQNPYEHATQFITLDVGSVGRTPKYPFHASSERKFHDVTTTATTTAMRPPELSPACMRYESDPLVDVVAKEDDMAASVISDFLVDDDDDTQACVAS